MTGKKAISLAEEVEDLGGETVIYTDIKTDGMLSGPNIEHIEALASFVGIQVIASGGVGSLRDLRELKALGKSNVMGVIIGKALYEKKFSLKDAVKTCS